ncbi:MAG: hypothetical protein Q7T82_02205 [Armatimonadota bacterium]|nr:hypothetical protein [Armatimonadota bacterium]
MANIGARMMRSFLLLGLTGVVVSALSGCKTMVATDRQSWVEPVALRKTHNGTWPRLTASTGRAPDSSYAEADTIEPYRTEPPATDCALMESARDDLRRSLLNIAEEQIVRETARMSEGTSARLEARRQEIEEANRREYAALSEKAAGDSAARVHQVQTELQGPRLNLRLKLAAVNARTGMFEGKLDREAGNKSDWLKAELERLDLKQAQSVQEIRDSESKEMSELKARQQSRLEAEIAQMRDDYGVEMAEQAKAQRNRLRADLAEEAISIGFDRSPRGCLDPTSKLCRALNGLNSRAAGVAERKFDRDLAAAQASMKSRRDEIREREAEDYSLTTGNLARARQRNRPDS